MIEHEIQAGNKDSIKRTNLLLIFPKSDDTSAYLRAHCFPPPQASYFEVAEIPSQGIEGTYSNLRMRIVRNTFYRMNE